MLTEINIDGMIGPTHHYGGLGVGNLSSIEHRHHASNPRQAALEGLAKAKLVSDLGIPQFIWFPPCRPDRELLESLGFRGEFHEQIMAAFETAPDVLSAAFSSAFMWAANSATVTPAVDARDRRYHFTPANLISSLHRASEARYRMLDIANTFSDFDWHLVHEPLPGITVLRDEGAANHMRLSDPTGEIGFNVFVYGDDDSFRANPLRTQMPANSNSTRFFARHTRTASETIARRHRLDPETTFFLQQHPTAIASGVFHNDVIATSHEDVMIHHELAYWAAEAELDRLERVFAERAGRPLNRFVVSNEAMSLNDAVKSYFFNSQLLSPPSKQRERERPRMVLVCPKQCQTIASATRLIEQLVADPNNPIDDVMYVAIGQSMAGGGGPACLRLRVPTDNRTLLQLPTNAQLNVQLYDRLTALIEDHYPEHITLASFCDERFVEHLAEIDRRFIE
jgi:succinylarginine dihydrolase